MAVVVVVVIMVVLIAMDVRVRSMVMAMVVVVMVVMPVAAQDEDTGRVHHETEDGDENGFVVRNGPGVDQADEAPPALSEGENRQEQGAGETTERVDFAGAETE